ncbi:MAG TPA: carboxypeptidase regulatory-like domain-containing protein [Candidatus Sulfotelmatobacter sp.]|nr:carboxypeptidase regulatory-like domain-containing protein [Candidatus Sulfotelmatobacter sp.]
MRKASVLSLVGGAFMILALAVPRAACAQAAVALSGQVSSKEEGAMEGVLVSAKRTGSTITVTVVSDRQGRYSFPAARLAPGGYALSVRAVGYELDGPQSVELATGAPASADLALRKADDLAEQLSNGEWLLSAPGSDQQKQTLLNCMSCHTVQRIVHSQHDAAEFRDVQKRMAGYANQSTSLHPQKRRAQRLLEERGEARDKAQQQRAEWLATINLSRSAEWDYPLKTLPRPSGRGTRVIITEYDLPRATIEPHDVMLDRDGMVWYSNFGEQKFGKLDPRTGKVTEYAVPVLKRGWPTGMLGLRDDKDGNLWLGLMYQGAIARFDRKAEKLETWSLPADINKDMTQINMVSPRSAGVDGKVWTQDNGFAAVHRFDVASGGFETFAPFKGAPVGENHNIYDVIPDSHNNAYFTDFANRHIGRIDAKTGAVKLFPTPTANSAPRRGMMDGEDRLWFAEYRGNRIAMFDTRTETFKEWQAPTPWSAPYDVALDKNGEAWTGSMSTDRILRLDPKSGQFVEYLLPRSTNIRRVFVDNTTTPVTFWVGSNHGASIVKLEPLD